MARYLQKISMLGKERWIGWDVDGVGTEVPGLILADELTEEEIRARGVKEFPPLPFETFLGMNPNATDDDLLLDEDIDYRLDALQVGMERIRGRGESAVSREVVARYFGDLTHLDHPRIRRRLVYWQVIGAVELVEEDDCYLRITGTFS